MREKSYAFKSVSRRLNLWKDQFREKEENIIFDAGDKEYHFTAEAVARSLRQRYGCETSLVTTNSIKTATITGPLRKRFLTTNLLDSYNVLIYYIAGKDLKKIEAENKYLINGLSKGKVQGYNVKDDQVYKVCSSEIIFDRIEKLLPANEPVKVENTYETMGTAVDYDLTGPRSLLDKKNLTIDDRFRNLFAVSLSSFYESSQVESGGLIERPPGKPKISYVKWGVESELRYTIYNQIHKIAIFPYILYERQFDDPVNGRQPAREDTLRQNLLTVTLDYNLNTSSLIEPYHRSHLETVVVPVTDTRPTFIRETVGGRLLKNSLEVSIGFGFEKYINDPVENALWGLEGLLSYEQELMKRLLYTISLKTFFSAEDLKISETNVRSDLSNIFSFQFTRTINIQFKQIWFLYHSGALNENYSNLRFITALNLKTDFKIY